MFFVFERSTYQNKLCPFLYNVKYNVKNVFTMSKINSYRIIFELIQDIAMICCLAYINKVLRIFKRKMKAYNLTQQYDITIVQILVL